MTEKFRNVNVGRDFPVNDDAIEGFESSVKANMQIRALSYLVDIIKNQEARISRLEAESNSMTPQEIEAEVKKIAAGLETFSEAKKAVPRKPKAAEADE